MIFANRCGQDEREIFALSQCVRIFPLTLFKAFVLSVSFFAR